MPRRKRAFGPDKPSISRHERPETVFRFKFLGIPIVVRPPRIVDLGKALAGAIPAMVGLASVLMPAIKSFSADAAARSVDSYLQIMSELTAEDAKSKAEVVFARLLKFAGANERVRDTYLDYLVVSNDKPRVMAVLGSMTRDDAKTSPQNHFRMANLLLGEPQATERQLQDAERHLRRTVELDGGPIAVLARRKLALMEIQRGDLATAVKTLEPIMTESPVAGAEALWLAWSNKLTYDPNAVDRVLDRVERDLRAQRIPDPENVLAKIRILVMTGRAQEATEWLALQKTLTPEARSAIETEFSEMQLVASMKASADGSLPDWSKLEQVLNRKPDDPIWLNFVVGIWGGPQRVGSEPARQWVQSRLEADTASDFLLRQALVTLSAQYEAFGRTAEDSKLLRDLYRKFLKRFPKDAVAMNNLAVLIYKHEPDHLEEGLKLAEAANGLVPEQPAIHETIGQTLTRMGRLDEARPILERCLGPLPQEWGLHNTLIRIYEKSGDTQLAKAHRDILAGLPRPLDAESFEKFEMKARPEPPVKTP
jgi:Tfp pilus assembly protein PilF